MNLKVIILSIFSSASCVSVCRYNLNSYTVNIQGTSCEQFKQFAESEIKPKYFACDDNDEHGDYTNAFFGAGTNAATIQKKLSNFCNDHQVSPILCVPSI